MHPRARTRKLLGATAAVLLSALTIPAALTIGSTAASAAPLEASGTVVDENGGGVETRMRLFAPGNLFQPVATFVSQADGSYTLPDVAAGDYKVRIESIDLTGPAPVWVGDTRDPAAATVVTIDGATDDLGTTTYSQGVGAVVARDFAGHVYNSNGTGSYVQLELYAQGVDAPVVTVPSETDGTWRIFNVPGGLWDVRAVPHQHLSEYPAWYSEVGQDRPASPRIPSTGSFVGGLDIQTQLNPEHELFEGGRVVGEDAEPIEDATVRVHGSGGFTADYPTDALGEFHFPTNMPDGEYLIEVSHPGHVTEWWKDAPDQQSAKPVLIIDGATLVRLNFRIAAAAPSENLIHGVVTGPSDERLDQAPVLLLSAPSLGSGNIVSTVFTNANGEYAFENVAAGTYFVYFRAPAQSGLVSEWWEDTTDAAQAYAVEIAGTGNTIALDAQLASDPGDENPGDEVCRDDLGNVIDCPEQPEVCRDDLGNVIDCPEQPEVCRDVLGNVIDCPEEPEVCRDDLGNVIDCPEQPEVCRDDLGNVIDCPEEPGCEEGDEKCPTEPEDCPAGTERHGDECTPTHTPPGGGDTPLARTGGEIGDAPLAGALLLGAGALLLTTTALRRRRRTHA